MVNERCLECELSWAASDGDLEALRTALLAGADPSSKSDCNTALFDAIDKGFVQILAVLMEAGADPLRRHPVTNQTPLMAALEGEQPEIIGELKSRGVAPASASLVSLVRGGDRPELVDLAFSGGVDLETTDPETGRTALHVAATYGYVRTVKRLIQAGADASARDDWGNTPAALASRNRHEQVVELLAEVRDEQE